jgi:hypothetical protein
MKAVAESAEAAWGVVAPHAVDAGWGIKPVAESAVTPGDELGARDVDAPDCGPNMVAASAADGEAGHGGVSTPATVIRPAELPHATQVARVSGDSLPQSGQSMNTS